MPCGPPLIGQRLWTACGSPCAWQTGSRTTTRSSFACARRASSPVRGSRWCATAGSLGLMRFPFAGGTGVKVGNNEGTATLQVRACSHCNLGWFRLTTRAAAAQPQQLWHRRGPAFLLQLPHLGRGFPLRCWLQRTAARHPNDAALPAPQQGRPPPHALADSAPWRFSWAGAAVTRLVLGHRQPRA